MTKLSENPILIAEKFLTIFENFDSIFDSNSFYQFDCSQLNFSGILFVKIEIFLIIYLISIQFHWYS